MLTVTEQEAMAREAAADKVVGYSSGVERRIFLSGWDAAMEYVKEQDAKAKLAEQSSVTDRH